MTAPEHLVTVDGVALACRETGAGRPFVWAHGLTMSMATEDEARFLDWSPIEARHRLIRYDARGHGASEGDPDPAHYEWPSLARDLLQLADALGLTTFAAGGASMGCATVLHAAVRAPERLERLVLVIPPTAGSGRRLQAAVYRGLSFGAATGLSAPLGLLARFVPPAPPGGGVRTALARAAMRHGLGADRRRVAPVYAGAARTDLPPAEALAGLTMPALVLAWHGDPVHPLTSARRLADLLPGATLHVASGDAAVAGWSALIADFLESPR